jgi:signal peptidase
MTIPKHIDFEVPGFGELSQPPIDVPTYRDAVMALNPLAYWRLGEATGTTLADETATHPLTLSGSFALGQAGALDRVSDTAVHFSDAAAQATGPVLPTANDAPFSIAIWARLPTGAIDAGPFLGQFASVSPGHTRLILNADGRLRLLVRDGEDSTSTNALTQAWRFVVLTRSAAGVLSWYFDGRLDLQETRTIAAIASTPFAIGNVTANRVNLYLDEAAIFGEALSPEAVRWLYGLGSASLALPAHL